MVLKTRRTLMVTPLPKIFTKEEFIDKLKAIKSQGWIKTRRPGNDGAVGNTLEDLLGIKENNLPIPNSSGWEFKAQRKGSRSLTTLFHSEPSPYGTKLVSSVLTPKYGWKHKGAGTTKPVTERSFRSTTSATAYTNRGFIIIVDRVEKKVKFSFNVEKADKICHGEWLNTLRESVGLSELEPQPYWGFDDLMYKAGSKLKNTFYILAESKWEGDDEYLSLYRSRHAN